MPSFLDQFVAQVAAAAEAAKNAPAPTLPIGNYNPQLPDPTGVGRANPWNAPVMPPGMLPGPVTPNASLNSFSPTWRGPAPISPPGMLPAPNVPRAGMLPAPVMQKGFALPPPLAGTAVNNLAPTAVSGGGAATMAAQAAGLAPPTLAPGAALPAPLAGTAIAGMAAPGAAATTAGAVAADVGLAARAKQLFPALGGAGLAKGAMVKGSLAATAGLMTSGWLDKQDFGGENSEMDQALKGGALGAGAIGGLALLTGATGGVAGLAALAGAAIFAGANMVFADNTTMEEKMDASVEKANGTIENILGNPAFGIDAETASQIRLQVKVTTELYKNAGDKAGLDQYLQGLASTVPSFLMEASARNAANQQKMQLQAAFGPVYSRMMERSSNVADQAYRTQMEAANAVSDPKVRAALQTQASQQYSAQADTQAAYAAQIAGASTQTGMPASAQAVQDQAGGLIQQAMGLAPAGYAG